MVTSFKIRSHLRLFFSREKRSLLILAGVLLPFSLAFLFHVEQKKSVQSGISGNTIYLLSQDYKQERRELKHIRIYHDPKSFLFPEDTLGFSRFRNERMTFDPPALSDPDPFPEYDMPPETGRSFMAEQPLVRKDKIITYDRPIMFDLKNRLPAAGTRVRSTAFSPVLCTPEGKILPNLSISLFDPDEIQKTTGPTKFLVTIPRDPRLPRHAEILESCGVEKLDKEACRKLNEILRNPTCQWKESSSIFTAFWKQKAAESEKEQKPQEGEGI